MRIATWNVNSLKARLERVLSWMDRTAPDVLLLQETKLTDGAAPKDVFMKLGYHFAHHGEGGRNGVAIASKEPIEDVVVNFGEPPVFALKVKGAKPDPDADYEPMKEARMLSVRTAGMRVVSLYAPNGRIVGTRFYEAKLAWFERLSRWLEETQKNHEPLIVGGDFNVTRDDRDVWDAKQAHGGTHVSAMEREAFAKFLGWGLTDAYRIHNDAAAERYTWWDYRAGDFYKNFGMRIDHLLLTEPLAKRVVGSEIDREARKGKPTPSDHAPLVLDLDEPGRSFDSGWSGAAERIAQRRAGKRVVE